MDTISLQYFIAAAEDLNFTKTAERVYATQQTLSNRIIRLEESLGVMLFNRKPRLSLTTAGEILLKHAKEILLCESNLYQSIKAVKDEQAGTIKIGFSTTRASILLPHILPRFKHNYPEVSIELSDYPSFRLQELTKEGSLDFAIGYFDSPSPELLYTPMLKDKLYFMVSRPLLQQILGPDAEEQIRNRKKGSLFRMISEIPLIMPNEKARLHRPIMHHFDKEDCKPNIYLSSTYVQFFVPLVIKGLVACFLPRLSMYASLPLITEDIIVIPIEADDYASSMTLSLIMYKKRYLPAYASAFIQYTAEYFQSISETTEFIRNA